MAETTNSTQTSQTSETPVSPETNVTPQTPPQAQTVSKVFLVFNHLITTTTWLVLGPVFIFLGFLFHYKNLIPIVFQPVFDRFIPHLPYFLVGLGLFCLGHSRSLVRQEYSKEYKKNRKFAHAWKVPLIATQVLILQFSGIFAVFVGFGTIPPIKSLIGLSFILLVVLCYLLWYVIAGLQNRFPSIAGLRIAFLATFLSVLCYGCWAWYQSIFLSLVFGLLAVLAAVSSVVIAPLDSTDQRATWVRLICLGSCIGLLGIVGWSAIPSGKSHANLVDLKLWTKDLQGQVGNLAYSSSPEPHPQLPQGNSLITPPLDREKLVFSQKTEDGWFLQIINPGNEARSVFKIPAGEGDCKPEFVDHGKVILLDALQGGERRLWKIRAANGSVLVLSPHNLEPFEDGAPWSEKTGEFLYVTKSSAGYHLNSLTLSTNRSKVLFSSKNPIKSPSWAPTPKEVVYADSLHGLPYILNVVSGKTKALMSDEERVEGGKLIDGPPVTEVIPAPDGFRYLYVTRKYKQTTIGVVLLDGTKRQELYSTKGSVRNISWFPDGQKIVFSEKQRQNGFFLESEGVRLLDANLGTVENLIPSQIASRSPVPSPDGAKVAFVSSQGLWYPSGNRTGIWVAVLR